MRILLVNDDGWDAPGLRAMVVAANEFGEIFSVAPLETKSGCGHQLTFDRPLHFVECGEKSWHVDGMPADCVRLAVSRLGKFDLVLSGINNGGNLGVDIYHSGTVAAAREASILGLPAIAISLYRRNINAPADWDRAARLAQLVLEKIVPHSLSVQAFWNVNVPEPQVGFSDEIPAIVSCPLDPSPLALTYEHSGTTTTFHGKYSNRPRQPGRDIETCFSGKIAVTKI